MPRSRTHLGDSHNFGRRVTARAERVEKPRTLLWEWLLLGADSPLRKLLDEEAEREGLGREAFGFLPSLQFSSPRSRHGGEVEPIALRPFAGRSREAKRSLAAIVGRAIALSSFLGIADLHWENLVLGVDRRGRTIFGPLDVEIILSDFAMPTETKLLPDADPEYAEICRHACGVRRVLPFLGKPVEGRDLVAMADAYHGTLTFLDRRATKLAELFARLPSLRETPIRVCLRGTDDYVLAGTRPLWPPLLEAEEEQLARGDIPYFFRLYGRPGIHYFGNRALTQRKTIPQKGDVPRLDPILKLSRGLRSPSRRKLREDGLFALLGAFDHPSLTGKHKSDSLEVTFGARTLVVKLPTGEALSSRRNLSAFVASVYLPCLCGEVRAVFVPPVTVCKPVRRGTF